MTLDRKAAREQQPEQAMAATHYDHQLKCWPAFFEPLWDGTKPFEVRFDDRGYKVGDVLKIREWNPETSSYTGRVVEQRVSYILTSAWGIGLEDGFVVLGLPPTAYIKRMEESCYAWEEEVRAKDARIEVLEEALEYCRSLGRCGTGKRAYHAIADRAEQALGGTT